MNYNKLTEGETERLSLLSEEMGEAIQAIGKILRHGYEPQAMYANRENLEIELGQVGYVIALMISAGDISDDNLGDAMDAKSENIIPYLHHQSQEILDELRDSA